MRTIIPVVTSILAVGLAGSIHSNDIVYPAGHLIECRYEVSDSVMAFGDTLTIQRELTNNEAYELSGLYFSDNLPPDFEIIAHSVLINGTPIDYGFTGPEANQVLPGYDGYYWIVDSPVASEPYHHVVGVGDTVTLHLEVISHDIGEYMLPFHSTVSYGNGDGIFASSGARSVRVVLASGIEEDGDSHSQQLPVRLSSTAFPNPFNSAVTITYSSYGLAAKPVVLEIFNLLGERVDAVETPGEVDNGYVRWENTGRLASGVYVYRISRGTVQDRGKLLLIK